MFDAMCGRASRCNGYSKRCVCGTAGRFEYAARNVPRRERRTRLVPECGGLNSCADTNRRSDYRWFTVSAGFDVDFYDYEHEYCFCCAIFVVELEYFLLLQALAVIILDTNFQLLIILLRIR